MIQIRRDVFETNSSSVHSITMCMKSDFDDWCDDKLWYYNSCSLPEGKTSPFFTWEEMIDFLKSRTYGPDEDTLREIMELRENSSSDLEQLLSEYEFYTYDSYETCHSDYEHYVEYFTTPSGEKVVSFGYAGANY